MKTDLVWYLTSTCCNPSKSILLRVIRRNLFTIWLVLTSLLITKNLSKCIATYKGHMDQDSQGLQFTETTNDEQTCADTAPLQEKDNEKTNDIFASVIYTTLNYVQTKQENLPSGLHVETYTSLYFTILT